MQDDLRFSRAIEYLCLNKKPVARFRLIKYFKSGLSGSFFLDNELIESAERISSRGFDDDPYRARLNIKDNHKKLLSEWLGSNFDDLFYHDVNIGVSINMRLSIFVSENFEFD